MNNNWTKEQISYLAGIIDGEGSVCIEIQSKSVRWSRKCDYYSLRLLVINTYLPMLQWIESIFGGTIRERKGPSHYRQCYRWNLCSHKASKVLVACIPYMIIKKKHAEIFIKFAETMTRANVRLSDEMLAYRKKLYLELKHINKSH